MTTTIDFTFSVSQSLDNIFNSEHVCGSMSHENAMNCKKCNEIFNLFVQESKGYACTICGEENESMQWWQFSKPKEFIACDDCGGEYMRLSQNHQEDSLFDKLKNGKLRPRRDPHDRNYELAGTNEGNCDWCKTYRTTEKWRRGPNGFRTLCSVCGGRYYKEKNIRWISNDQIVFTRLKLNQ